MVLKWTDKALSDLTRLYDWPLRNGFSSKQSETTVLAGPRNLNRPGAMFLNLHELYADPNIIVRLTALV